MEITNQNIKNFESVWKTSTFKSPSIFLGFYDGNIYATVDDSSYLYRFVSKEKNDKQAIIYIVVKSKCKKYTMENGIDIWVINDTIYDKKINKKALQVISCKNNDESMVPSYDFVVNTLSKLIP